MYINLGSNHTTPFLLKLISGHTSCPDAAPQTIIWKHVYKKDEFGVNIFSIGSVFVHTWHSHWSVGGVINAMNIKEREYKYNFFISTAYTILSV